MNIDKAPYLAMLNKQHSHNEKMAHYRLCFGILLVSLIAQNRFALGDRDDARKLYLLTILPYPSASPSEQPSWNQGTNILPAAYLAVDMINDRDDILGGYTLDLINSGGGCDIADTARISFVRRVISERGQKPVVGIIGPGCSTSTLAVSSHSSHSEIALLNIHLAGTPLLENRTKFAYSLGFLGSSYGFVDATVALMRTGKWKRIAVLYDEERTFFLSTYQALERDLQLYIPDAELAFTSAVYDTYFPIADIVALDIRVIIILTGVAFARKIMCLSSYGQIMYPRYQFVLMGRDISEFEESITFTYVSNEYSCSTDVLHSALIGSILVNYQLKRHDSFVTKAHITYNQYVDLYNERVELYNHGQADYVALGDPNFTAETNRYATLVFDAIWAFALALSKSETLVNLTSYGLHLGQIEESNIIRDNLINHTFEGVSGHVLINVSNGYTERIMELYQINANNRYTAIGYIEGQDFVINSTPSLVPGEFQSEGLQLVNVSVAVVLSVFTIVIISLTIVVHGFAIAYREHPTIKAQSPKLNQISYVGFYLFAAGTLLSIMHKTLYLDTVTYGNICQAIWPWCFSIAFSVFFAPICARTWRLYRIFAHYLNPGPFISDPILLSVVGICVTIDVLLAIIWTAVDPFQGEEIKGEVNNNGEFSTRLSCYCQYTIIWYSGVYGLKLFLLVGTVVLSLLTRSITNDKFKTSFLRVFVYLFALVWTNGLILYYILGYQGLNIHVDYVILAVMCNTILLLSLLFVFLPPTYPIIKEKINPTVKAGKYFLYRITLPEYLSSELGSSKCPTSRSF